nr:HPF/RaiA family ribosome-associated protein [uncultured Duganella sp.]
MNIAIQSNGLVLTESLRAYVYRRLQTSLGWALTRRLAVWLSDINGPRGGRDKRCKIQISLDNGKTVVIEDTEEDMYAAIDRAAERADRALARRLARGRAFTHDKAATLAPVEAPSDGDGDRDER